MLQVRVLSPLREGEVQDDAGRSSEARATEHLPLGVLHTHASGVSSEVQERARAREAHLAIRDLLTAGCWALNPAVEVRILVSELCAKPVRLRRWAVIPVSYEVAGADPVAHPGGSRQEIRRVAGKRCTAPAMIREILRVSVQRELESPLEGVVFEPRHLHFLPGTDGSRGSRWHPSGEAVTRLVRVLAAPNRSCEGGASAGG
jgi:hypothetical protein